MLDLRLPTSIDSIPLIEKFEVYGKDFIIEHLALHKDEKETFRITQGFVQYFASQAMKIENENSL